MAAWQLVCNPENKLQIKRTVISKQSVQEPEAAPVDSEPLRAKRRNNQDCNVKFPMICGGIAALCAATSALATLGGAPSFQGARHTSSELRTMGANGAAMAPWSVNTATDPNGAVIREYIDGSGTVFAVSWRGPRVESFDALLGAYFPVWQQGVAAAHAARGGGHGPVAVRDSGLVVESGGHMGALNGRAWLPASLPQGFTTEQIQ